MHTKDTIQGAESQRTYGLGSCCVRDRCLQPFSGADMHQPGHQLTQGEVVGFIEGLGGIIARVGYETRFILYLFTGG